LEHLYWGVDLGEKVSLTYLQRANVKLTFQTAPSEDVLTPAGPIDAVKSTAETMTPSKAWKKYRGAHDVYRRRAENASWRIWGRHRLGKPNTPASPSPLDKTPARASSPVPVWGRNRSFSSTELFKMSSSSGPTSVLHKKKNVAPHHADTGPVAAAKKELVGPGTIKQEFSDHGTGDFRSPSFQVSYEKDGSFVSPLTYKSHKIINGRLPMKVAHMPHIRSWAANKAEEADFGTTLVVTLVDSFTNLEVDLNYTVVHDHDVLLRSTVFRNPTRAQVLFDNSPNARNTHVGTATIHRAMSASLDFENERGGYQLTYLSGSWARERHVEHTRIQPGLFSIGSTRGTSSHVHNPFAVLSRGSQEPRETDGDVFGFALVYSGNHIVEAEGNEVGRVRFNIGIHPTGFCWSLPPGAEFQTPECVMVYSQNGLGGMSRIFHRLFLNHLIPKQWAARPQPILLNSWEAQYFDVSHDAITEMAMEANKLGIEMIVLDDGWFGKRNDANSSLGDWFPNRDKFPFGIRGCAHSIESMGMKMGLWFEPEMVSTDSELYRAHPDWCLHVPGRPSQRGRNQLVLDMGRADVRAYLLKKISKILKSASISYVKWDMNRYLTEVFSLQLQKANQGEASHRFMMGTYELLHSFVTAFPDLLLETCSGGGGRFDPGMLYYSPQIWTSDNTDAMNRVPIQYGTSLLYPARCMGSHYSVSPNHITMRQCRSRTRAFVAMCGTFGFELNLHTIPMDERKMIPQYIRVHREVREIVNSGDLFRLWSPSDAPSAAWMYVTVDRKKAVVFAFNMGMRHWSDLMPTLRLQGLDQGTDYAVTEPMPNEFTRKEDNLQVVRATEPSYQLRQPKVWLSGAALMEAGLPIQFFASDDATCFVLTAESKAGQDVAASGPMMRHVGSNIRINNMGVYTTISDKVTSLTVENIRSVEWSGDSLANEGQGDDELICEDLMF
jgi:alpha-galactosidase